MTITNELKLPEPLVAAIRNDNYNSGDCQYSTTTLIKPPRIVALTRGHSKQLTEDASDRLFALMGQAVHSILERAASDRYIVEKRYIADFGGIKVGGQIDVFDTHTGQLSDYKITSRYATGDGPKPEWIAQASINRLLMERHGILVESAQIVAIFRDWSKMAAARSSNYPMRQVEVMPLPLWPLKQTEEYILSRIAEHEAAKTKLPMCSPEDRWAKPNKWALMAKGKKRAVKLYEVESEAYAAAEAAGEKHFVEDRPGEDIRCLYYCPVSAFCEHGRAVLREKMEVA